MNVHKTPLRSRPIVSCSGSLLHALGVWIDTKFQLVAAKQHTYFKSSFDLKQELLQLHLPPGARFFVADAVSMYTNIQTAPALREIARYLHQHAHQFADIPIAALIDALRLVMNNNIVQFGDTHWKQITGCAMGTPPAPPYATVFYAIWEETLLREYGRNLFLLRRYIDDMLGIWIPTPDDAAQWTGFCNRLNDYHDLTWEVSDRSTTVDFLDLTLTMQASRITTSLYSKPLNLYLYIPPRSAHPPGVLQGLISGTIHRIHTLCSDPLDIRQRLQDFWNRLLARGYEKHDLLKPFSAGVAMAKAHLASLDDPPPPNDPCFFFHLQYHPQDPPSSAIQKAWHQTVSHPRLVAPLADLKFLGPHNHRRYRFDVDRLIVCYHRPPNLGNLLSYRRIKPATGPPVSSFLND